MRRTTIGTAAAVVLAAAVALVPLACGGEQAPSAELASLKADAIARYEPAGGKLVQTEEQNAGTALGKPSRSRYRRMFELPEGSPEGQLEAAVAAARAAGWTIDPGPVFRAVGSLSQTGTKDLETGRAEVGLTVFVDSTSLGGDVSPPALLVSLQHLR